MTTNRNIDIVITAELSNGADQKEMGRILTAFDKVQERLGEYDIINTRNESDVTAMRRVFTIDVDARDVWPSKVEDAVHEVIEDCGDFVPKEIFSVHLI